MPCRAISSSHQTGRSTPADANTEKSGDTLSVTSRAASKMPPIAMGGILEAARLVTERVSPLFSVFASAGVDLPVWWLLLIALHGMMTAAILVLLERSGWSPWRPKPY